MKIFPQKEFEIQAQYSMDEVRGKLYDAAIQPKDKIKTKLFPREKSFRGEFDKDDFLLKPIGLKYGSYQFRPVITGSIVTENNKAVLRGDIKASKSLKAVMILIPIMIIILVIIAITTWIMSFQFDEFVILPFFFAAIFLLNYGLFYWAFNLHAKRCINLFNEILKLDEEEK